MCIYNLLPTGDAAGADEEDAASTRQLQGGKQRGLPSLTTFAACYAELEGGNSALLLLLAL